MAQDPPPSVDVTDIQFKVHDRFTVFNAADKLRSSVNLLAAASNYGLMFVGNPNEAELKVILIKDLVDSKTSGRGLHARQVQLPNLPNCLAVSSDGSMLAVNYTQNGCGFVIIYSVPSFTTANIKPLHNIRLPGDENISALQLLWNPVISGSLAVVMNNGALGMYDFKNNSYEFHTLDSKEQINCGSWSPKGKQIVLGFPNGKLAQYKPDLKLARTIVCPPNIYPGPFDTISIQWLSTFQFAVVFLQKCEDSTPSLYIVHAPKIGTPTYTNYYDICYSGTGPRAQQVNLTHIPQWNLLLVTSANGVEVGILGTKETTEAPTWIQYTLLDEARIEMPLTDDKDETYPIGFALDISSTHSLTIAEKKMPVMPMIHVLSTHGQLVAFNFLNLQPNTPDICSPPPPPSDTSGMSQFKPVSDMLNQRKSGITIPATTLPLSAANQSAPIELSFPPLGITSTPALEKPKAIFGTPSSTGSSMFGAPTSGFSFHSQATAPIATSAPSFFRNPAPQQPTQQSVGTADVKKQPEQHTLSTLVTANNPDKSKPLYTVQSTFTPPAVVMPTPTGQNQSSHQQAKLPQINANEIDDIVNEMIVLQINSFDMELKKMASQSKGLLNNIGNTDEMKTYTKKLNDLQEIIDQADDKEFESDLQGLRNLLNETYAMVAECRSKLNMYNNPDIAKLKNTSNCNPINRRQLAKLQSYLANNQAQLQIINNQIDAQWSNFQDIVRRNSKTQMHTPCLEGIYQRMTKLKDMIARERTKLNYIKSKLKEKGLLNNQLRNTTKPEVTMESLTDTILSMSLGPTVEENRSKLTKEKLTAIREKLKNRKITIIKPQRPDRVGLNSEVILETKLKSDRKIRDGAATNMDKMEQERIKTEQQRVLTKPTATKAVASSMATISQPSMASISQPNAPATFGFGGISPFVKPNPAKPEEFKKEQQHQQPAIVKPVASTAAPMFLKSTPSTTATPSAFGGFGAPPNASAGFPGLSITPTTMPAFSGFGANKPLTFGAPKPLIPNPPAKETTNNDNALKEQTPPTGFAPKPMASEAKPFAMPNFSSPFTAVAPSKPTAADIGDKENKTPDTQSFMPVAIKSEIAPVPSSAPSLNFGSTTVSSAPQIGFSFGIGNTAAPTLAKTTSATGSGPFTFSFSSALNSGADTTNTAPKSVFAGLQKPAPLAAPATAATKTDAPAEVTQTQAQSEPTESTTDSTGSLNLGTLGLPVTPNLSPTPSVSTLQSSSTLSVASVKTTASAADPTDSLFGGLNICKPLGAENGSGAFKSTFGGGNIFGSTSFAPTDTTTDTKSIFGAAAATKEPAAFTGFGTAANTTKPAFDATVVSTTPAASAASVTTTSSNSIFGPKVTQAFSFGLTTPTTGGGSIATGQAAQTAPAPSMFSALTTASSFGATPAATTTVATSTSTGGSIFSGLTFGTPTSQPTSSIFGAAASSVSTTPTSAVSASVPQYLNTNTSSMPVATPFGGAAATSAGSLFSSVAPTTTSAVSTASGNIFGGIPKPDQSVFGQSDGNVFGTPTADTTTSGGSLFGGQTSAFGALPSANTGGSIFGGSATAPNAFGGNAGSNIFANSNTNSAPNVFAAPAQSTGASGGSIFDQSAASGQSGGSLFGGGGTGFGTPSSPFGGNAASGGSIFGGSATSTSPKPSTFGTPAPSAFGSANTGGFGLFSQTPAFGSTSPVGGNTGGGSFAQGGSSSISQTGFGSPTGGTAFTKPVFGAAPSFGGAPTFGSPPSFGTAATFGSPKAFGSFAAPNTSGGAFTSPTQKNNLFEALGSSDTGLSFGNLAQNTNANQQKPAFGGSSFMSYRS